eukprot:179291_1
MGAICVPEGQIDPLQNSDDEKTHIIRTRDSSHWQQQNNAEFKVMQQEVVLLSTSKANLTQQLEESKAQIAALKDEVYLLTDGEDELSLDIIHICNALSIDYAKHIMEGTQQMELKKVNIANDLMDLEMDDATRNKIDKYLSTFNTNVRLFLLFKFLKEDHENTEAVARIFISLLYKTMYRMQGEDDNEESDLATICKIGGLLNESEQTIRQIQTISKQEVTAQRQFANDLF